MAVPVLTNTSYFFIYTIIVFVIFCLVYLGYGRSINEAECLSVALIAGLIFLAIFYRPMFIDYLTQIYEYVFGGLPIPPELITQIELFLLGTIILVVLSFLIIIITGINLMVFDKKKNLKIFKIDENKYDQEYEVNQKNLMERNLY